MRKISITTAGAALLIAMLLLPAAALAKRGDRNHDRIPDRWERTHRLSLRLNQAKKDQDRDGLKNLAEYRAHTDPRDADTDSDGVEDGDDRAPRNPEPRERDASGTVTSYDGNVLTIMLANGDEISGRVHDGTEISCEDAKRSGDQPAAPQRELGARAAGYENDYGSGVYGIGGDGPGAGDPADGTAGDPPAEDPFADGCSSADLEVGIGISEATLVAKPTGAVFTEIQIVR